MFSDDSELSDYNPFAGDSDDDEPPAPPKPDDAPAQKTKRNYFRNAKEEPAVTASVPLTMDPVLAASLRKVAALRDATKKEVLREATEKDVTGEEAQTKNPKAMGMSLGGAGGVYEFDDGDMEWEEEDSMPVGPKKKKRKEK
jgi:transcriptional regulator of met regulon